MNNGAISFSASLVLHVFFLFGFIYFFINLSPIKYIEEEVEYISIQVESIKPSNVSSAKKKNKDSGISKKTESLSNSVVTPQKPILDSAFFSPSTNDQQNESPPVLDIPLSNSEKVSVNFDIDDELTGFRSQAPTLDIKKPSISSSILNSSKDLSNSKSPPSTGEIKKAPAIMSNEGNIDGQSDDNEDRIAYSAYLSEKINSNWLISKNVDLNFECIVEIILSREGELLSYRMLSDNLTADQKESIETAIVASNPFQTVPPSLLNGDLTNFILRFKPKK